MGALSKEWAISMAFSLALLLIFGLGLVWVNIERVDLAYELNKIQHQIDEREVLSAKLEVERNTLITPSRLREFAKERGLGPARPGQIRRVAANGEIEASPLLAVTAEPAPKAAKAAVEPAKPVVKATAEVGGRIAAKASRRATRAVATPKPFESAPAGGQ